MDRSGQSRGQARPFAIDGSDIAEILDGDPRLERLQSYMVQNLEAPMSLRQAAEIAGLERTYFSRFFRKLTGYTFSHWNGAFRTERAAELLRRTRLRISSIAHAVGYGDLTTFERAFSRFVGISPSAYRDACNRRRARNAERITNNAE